MARKKKSRKSSINTFKVTPGKQQTFLTGAQIELLNQPEATDPTDADVIYYPADHIRLEKGMILAQGSCGDDVLVASKKAHVQQIIDWFTSILPAVND